MNIELYVKKDDIMRNIPMTAVIYAAARIRQQCTTNTVTRLSANHGSCSHIDCDECPIHSGYMDQYHSYCYANQIMNLVMTNHDLLGCDRDPDTHAKIVMLLIGNQSPSE